MAATGNSLFPHLTTEQVSPRTTGILPAQTIRELIAGGRVQASEKITEEQIQPASIDLRLGIENRQSAITAVPLPSAATTDTACQSKIGNHQSAITGLGCRRRAALCGGA